MLLLLLDTNIHSDPVLGNLAWLEVKPFFEPGNKFVSVQVGEREKHQMGVNLVLVEGRECVFEVEELLLRVFQQHFLYFRVQIVVTHAELKDVRKK